MLHFVSKKKVVGIHTKSRKEHAIAQTRELACTKEVLPDVIGKGEVNVSIICYMK